MEETCDVSFFIPGIRKTGLQNRRKYVIMEENGTQNGSECGKNEVEL